MEAIIMDDIIIGIIIVVFIVFVLCLVSKVDDKPSVPLTLPQRVAQGDTKAMLELAQVYAEGKRVKKNTAMALKLLLDATKLGNKEAKLKLDQILVDFSVAINTQLDSDHEALFLLGTIYYTGIAGQQDYAKAFEFYKKSAELGNSAAECYLGVMYREGQGVSQDYNQAFIWFKKSAENGELDAKFYLGSMYLKGLGVEQDYKVAFKYYKEVEEAVTEHVEVLFNLGLMYFSGKCGTQDYKLAFDYFNRAANLGNADAQNKLGYMYAHGITVSKNYVQAERLYNAAIAQGSLSAMSNLVLLKQETGSKKSTAAQTLAN